MIRIIVRSSYVHTYDKPLLISSVALRSIDFKSVQVAGSVATEYSLNDTKSVESFSYAQETSERETSGREMIDANA